MIELIEGVPDGVIGFEAVGNVTLEDYAEVVAPAVQRALARRDSIRLLHVIGDRFTGHSASALLEDARLGLSNVRSIERIAVVTDRRHFRRPGQGRRVDAARRAEVILERRTRSCRGVD